MTRFIAELNGGDHINIPADRMEMQEEGGVLMVYRGQELVAFVDLSAVVTAHISERSGPR